MFLSGIMVDALSSARAVVTFGDSITDGVNSTPEPTTAGRTYWHGGWSRRAAPLSLCETRESLALVCSAIGWVSMRWLASTATF